MTRQFLKKFFNFQIFWSHLYFHFTASPWQMYCHLPEKISVTAEHSVTFERNLFASRMSTSLHVSYTNEHENRRRRLTEEGCVTAEHSYSQLLACLVHCMRERGNRFYHQKTVLSSAKETRRHLYHLRSLLTTTLKDFIAYYRRNVKNVNLEI